MGSQTGSPDFLSGLSSSDTDDAFHTAKGDFSDILSSFCLSNHEPPDDSSSCSSVDPKRFFFIEDDLLADRVSTPKPGSELVRTEVIEKDAMIHLLKEQKHEAESPEVSSANESIKGSDDGLANDAVQEDEESDTVSNESKVDPDECIAAFDKSDAVLDEPDVVQEEYDSVSNVPNADRAESDAVPEKSDSVPDEPNVVPEDNDYISNSSNAEQTDVVQDEIDAVLEKFDAVLDDAIVIPDKTDLPPNELDSLLDEYASVPDKAVPIPPSPSQSPQEVKPNEEALYILDRVIRAIALDESIMDEDDIMMEWVKDPIVGESSPLRFMQDIVPEETHVRWSKLNKIWSERKGDLLGKRNFLSMQEQSTEIEKIRNTENDSLLRNPPPPSLPMFSYEGPKGLSMNFDVSGTPPMEPEKSQSPCSLPDDLPEVQPPKVPKFDPRLRNDIPEFRPRQTIHLTEEINYELFELNQLPVEGVSPLMREMEVERPRPQWAEWVTRQRNVQWQEQELQNPKEEEFHTLGAQQFYEFQEQNQIYTTAQYNMEPTDYGHAENTSLHLQDPLGILTSLQNLPSVAISQSAPAAPIHKQKAYSPDQTTYFPTKIDNVLSAGKNPSESTKSKIEELAFIEAVLKDINSYKSLIDTEVESLFGNGGRPLLKHEKEVFGELPEMYKKVRELNIKAGQKLPQQKPVIIMENGQMPQPRIRHTRDRGLAKTHSEAKSNLIRNKLLSSRTQLPTSPHKAGLRPMPPMNTRSRGEKNQRKNPRPEGLRPMCHTPENRRVTRGNLKVCMGN